MNRTETGFENRCRRDKQVAQREDPHALPIWPYQGSSARMSQNDVAQAQSRFQNDVVRGSLQVPSTGNHLVDIFNHLP